MPILFVSHGSPMTALEPREAGAFFQQLGQVLDSGWGRPRAVLAISAHSLARRPTVLAASRHEAVHDFGGFPPELYTLRYDVAGAPALAHHIAQGSQDRIQSHPSGGLDHGIWTPLRYIYPQADVPVVPLAFNPGDSPARQFELGRLLSGLSHDGVLILASGSITHNLGRVFKAPAPAIDAPEAPESAAFRRWFEQKAAAADWAALLDYRQQAPSAQDMHPTDEHLLPWYVAAGAGGSDDPALRLHASLTYGALGMDAYAFGPSATALRKALLAV